MAVFSNYYLETIIDHMLRGAAFTPPATVYVALFSADTGLHKCPNSGTNWRWLHSYDVGT